MAEHATDSEAAVQDFLTGIQPEARREDGLALDSLFRDVTGFAPRLWGAGIVGYGRYAYHYASGTSGETLATGFSPRKANLVLYIMPGYADLSAQLAGLGKHKIGKSCLYINRLADVDRAILADIIRTGLADLSTRWSIAPA